MTTWEHLQAFADDYGPTIFLFAVVIIALFLIYKIWPLLSNTVIVVNALAELPKLHDTVKDIKKEVLPNGGSSMRDALDVVRDDLSHVRQGVTDLSTRLDNHIAAAELTEQVRVADRQAGTAEGAQHHES